MLLRSYRRHLLFQFDVAEDGFRVKAGDLLGVTNDNSGWNVIGYDDDVTQFNLVRRRHLMNGLAVFADLPRLDDIVDDFTNDTAPKRFSVAVRIHLCKLNC